MDLTTRCPQCGTTFSASLEQLQLRKGYIRCINCAHIFDGYDAVVSPSEASAPAGDRPSVQREPSVSMPSVLRQRPSGTHDAAHRISPSHPRQGPAFTISEEREQVSGQDPVFRLDADSARIAPESGAGPLRVEPELAGTRNRPAGAAPASPQIYMEPRQPGAPGAEGRARAPDFLEAGAAAGAGVGRVLWRLLVVVGVLLLLAQLAYVYRAQIANNVPVLRPMLERACASLDCTVPYARRIDQISIMSSSLRSGSGAAVGAAPSGETAREDGQTSPPMLLQFTLRNTYDKPQEWPTLVLDLTDFSGTLLVRKNLPPSSYLTPEIRRQPFRAGGEITVSVPVVLHDLRINGYQLDKFFQ